ncbi:EGF-like domain containing protein [Nitzschia inconspicua]|uniref:EGF-like domain containing protein n=1 Tax=Nitzschia inconspicua TaxID=303405 RepID=A0A9K3M7N2_9STRA|nr:EGF-like domain containing protein [Nitzschia inconspicua]
MASPTLCLDDYDCLNGGSCDSPFDFLSSDHVDATSTAKCICPPGFGGLRCEQTCPIRCENKGQCDIVDEHGGFDIEYRCICPSGFSGLRCENSQGSVTPLHDVSVVPSTHSQLGTGPIAGITVGIVLVMLLVMSSIIYIVKVSKKKKQERKPSKEESPETENEDAEEERVEEILGLEEGEFVEPKAAIS